MSVKLLDCTLRDGGHVNNADFGAQKIRSIIQGLVTAGIDYIELGFLRDGCFSPDQTLYNDVSEIYPYLPDKAEGIKYTVMIRPDWYDIRQLSESEEKIDIIRFAFYYKDIDMMRQYANIVAKKRYKYICNPVNIMGYSDTDLVELIEQVNDIHPEQFTIVDTYGSMTIEDLYRIYGIMEQKLDCSIRIGLHLHENQSLAFGIAQEFLRIKENGRDAVIDGSLLGMGRIPGNLCTEIISDYMNSRYGCNYNNDILYQIIGEYIEPIKQEISWGYSPAYFISARLNMHRSYAEYILKKQEFSLYEICQILKSIDKSMRSEFHNKHLEEKCEEYRRRKKDEKHIEYYSSNSCKS